MLSTEWNVDVSSPVKSIELRETKASRIAWSLSELKSDTFFLQWTQNKMQEVSLDSVLKSAIRQKSLRSAQTKPGGGGGGGEGL